MHKKLNFNAIFFESGISELAYVNEKKKDLSATDMLMNSLFYVWHTETNVQLMQYIKDNNIQIFGLDHQYTSDQYSEYIKLAGKSIDLITSTQKLSLTPKAFC